MYARGQGVAPDEAEATVWMRRAAEGGNPEAQSDLASRLAIGKGVPKDDAEAMKWYEQAAERGILAAQKTLGLRYMRGDGLVKDTKRPVTGSIWPRPPVMAMHDQLYSR